MLIPSRIVNGKFSLYDGRITISALL